jgi:hypothetical protein
MDPEGLKCSLGHHDAAVPSQLPTGPCLLIAIYRRRSSAEGVVCPRLEFNTGLWSATGKRDDLNHCFNRLSIGPISMGLITDRAG